MLRPDGILYCLLFGFCSSVALVGTAGGAPAGKSTISLGAPILTGCQPGGTPKDDVIFCLGTDLSGVSAGRGDDQITISLGALVSTFALDPSPFSTGIDGGDGDDIIINNGTLIVDVFSLGNGLKSTPALGSGKSPGSGSATDNKKAAKAIGIDGGAGDDDIRNAGTITVISSTIAGGLSTGPGIGGGSVGSSEARAVSSGISGGDGDDRIFNSRTVTAVSEAVALKGEISTGLGASTSNDSATAEANATGIDGGADADIIINDGTVVAVANATIASAGSPGGGDDSSADGGNTAEATATGISGGDGNDGIDNSGDVVAVAVAESESFTLALSANGSAEADSTSTANSSATAIDAGNGVDVVDNDGSLVAIATSISAAQGAQVSDSGGTPLPKSSWKGGAAAESTAVGISTGEGNDSVTNDGTITAAATSVTGTATVAASASDTASAASDAKATAKATGIDTGDGGDWVTNDGSIVAVSTATAGAIDFALSQNGAAKAAHEGGATAEAEATGIRADSGENNEAFESDLKILPHSLMLSTRLSNTAPTGTDTISNTGEVTAVATAIAGSEGVAVSISGAATSNMSATSKSTAAGIDAGAGDDEVTSSGAVTAISTATSGAIGISFSESGKSAVKGGPEAEATAIGISGDGTGTNLVHETTLEITTDTVATTLSREKTAASGADRIDNSGAVTAIATAVSGSEGGAISISGAASGDFNAKTTSKATALDVGAGDDTVTNSGALTAVSTATAGTAGIGFSESGKSSAKAEATAEAEATGISGDGAPGGTFTEGTLSIGLDGVAIGFRHEKNAATGNDNITNTDAVTAVATAVSGSGTGAVSISGAASAEAKSVAKALAVGIDAGNGDDTVTNSGALTVISTATAATLGISFSESGEAKVEGGPEAEAEAIGISGDGTLGSSLLDTSLAIGPDGLDASILYAKTAASGADTITNSGAVTSVATAASGSGGASVSISGASSLDTSSEAKAIAVGVDAGGGDDSVANSGVLTSVATAAAGSAGIGFSESDKGEAKAGATAEAEAFGIRGDGTEASSSIEATLAISPGKLAAGFRYEKNASSGADTITNDGVVTAVATAISGSEAVGVSISKAASADAKSTSTATAVGIDAGAGDDTVSNSGVLTSVSTATALTLGAGISESKEGAASAAATSEATAIGISGDGILGSRLAEGSLTIEPNSLELSAKYEQTSATGTDSITNDGVITAAAVATSGSGSLGVSIKGAASADASSTAISTAAAIDAGGGDDEVANNGVLTSVAIATAGELSAAVSGKGNATSLKSIWQGGSNAEATAIGIAGDSSDKDFSTESTLSVDLDAPSVEAHSRTSLVQAGGNDTITNNGVLTATAIATTPSVDVTVALDGMAASVTTSEASASAIAIDGGTGDDVILNSGVLTATSLATAATANVVVSPKGSAIAADSVWDGGTTAESTAIGIAGDGEGQEWSAEGHILASEDGVRVDASFSSTKVAGDDDITNDGVMVITSVALVPSVTVAVPVKGAGAAISASTSTATAIGIDAGSGDDTVLNRGALVSTSLAVAAAANVAVSKNAALAGNSFWDGGTTANSRAVGISGDGEGGDLLIEGTVEVTADEVLVAGKLASTTVSGDDDITNEAAIVVTSIAEVPSLSVAVTSKGVSAAISAATANSQAVGIDAGAGDDVVSNNASITATSIANANVANVAVVVSGGVAAAWDGGATANAEATGISGDGEGQDLVVEGSILVNDETVRLSSRYSDTTVKGDDSITNDGVITATALAAAPSLGVAVTPSAGLSVAVTNAAANSKATGIDAGSGDDVVDNNGVLTATSVALAASASVAYVSGGVTVAGNSVWDGGTRTEAEAVGISGDGVGRDLIIKGEIEVADGDVRIGSELTDKTVAGDDTITNTGVVTASSLASSTSAGVSVTLSGGVSVALATSTAKAKAAAIDAGSGDDVVDNTGVLTSTAIANANTLSVAYATAGVAVAADAVMDGGTTAEAEAIGIDGDGVGRDLTIASLIEVNDAGTLVSGRIAQEEVAGYDVITNDGVITATAVALAPSIGVAVTPGGLSVALTTASTKARSAAIDAGAGDDVVDNTGVLTTTSAAVAVAVPIAVTPAGVAIAADAVWDGGTTAEAEAIGISGDGAGADFVSELSVEVVDGDVSIKALDAATVVGGDDTIINSGVVTATAGAESLSAAVSVTPAGLAVAASTSTAKSRAAAIDAGSGDDIIDNSGTLTSTSVANANALSVAVTPAGLSVAGGTVFDGGTHAEAEAIGISGDGLGRDDVAEFSTNVDDEGIRIFASDSSKMVSSDDDITNSGRVTATSVAVASSVAVAVTPAGVSVASTTSTAKARAAAIDAGSGDDVIDNSGKLVATSVADANTVSVSVTAAGVSVASDAVWDGGTHAESDAVGIAGDGEGRDDIIESSVSSNNTTIELSASIRSEVVNGDDDITNSGEIIATAVAVVPSINVAVTPTGGLSVSLSTASTNAKAVAIDAGSGDDIVDNTGALTAISTAVSVAIPVSVTVAGVAIAGDAIWDGGTHAEAEAVGISGDGKGTDYVTEFGVTVDETGISIGTLDSATVVSGNDTITNDADVTAVAVGVATSIGVSVTPAGVSVSASTATAKSRAAAIDAGSGDDTVENDGHLTASATSVGVAIPVAVAPIGFAVAADAIWDGGTSAEAEAVGIDGDGRGTDFSTENTIESTEAGTLIQRTVSSSVVSGDDSITNTGLVDATAVAVAPSIAFSLGVVGGVSVANATANSYAAAIDAGAGNDDVLNQGDISANSVANANAAAISVGALAASGNAIFDGGTTSEAEAVGIYGDGRGGNESSVFTIESDGVQHSITHVDSFESAVGNDTITNEAMVEAYATAVSPSVSLAVGGMGVAISTSTARARAAAIDAGAGDDVVNNSGALTADADAVAVTANVSASGVALAADAVWDGGTTAEAEAVGISGDGQATSESTTRGIEVTDGAITIFEQTNSSSLFGNDDITNDATIDASAGATAVSVGVAFSGLMPAAAISTATAQSRAAAIEAGGGDDVIVNNGALTAEAGSVAVAASVSFGAGITASLDSFWDGGTTATAEAVGIDGDGQKDSITRDKTITVSATAIDISDETERTSTDGDDSITNTASISSDASANSTSVGVSFNTLIGAAVAISTSTAESKSTAIRGGGGDDIILNQGALTATSSSDADGVSVSIVPVGAAVALDAFWDGGTTAEATSSGIDGGAGNDTITNESSVLATSVADARSTGVAITVGGIAAANSASTANASATAINGASGDDTIDNSGNLEAASSATAKGTSVSVGLVGFASADSSAVADSLAVGINTGNGADVVSNTGDILAGASANATGANVTVTLVGAGFADSLFEGETRADALAAGIVGGDGVDDLTNDAVIALGSNAEISAVSVSVDLVGFADADASATASAESIGMSGGDANDILNNRGVIAGSAESSAPARSFSIGLIGASSADASTTAIAAASGMEGGAGDDGMYNLGTIALLSRASAQAKSVNVTLAGAGHADANAYAIANALGLGGGAGDDEVFNFGTISLGSTAEARALGTSVGIFGVASQTATTTATAFATGLDGGSGDDLVANTGFLQVQANANANMSNAAWQLAGTASQQGFVSAEALSIGMSGGAGLDILFNDGSIDVDVNSTLNSEGSVTAVFGAGSANGSLDGTLGAIGISGGQGDDQIINAGLVSLNSNLNASSSGTAWNLFGVAGVTAGMSSETSLFGFAGGDDNDLMANTGTLLVGAYSSMTASNSSWTFGGASNGAGSLSSITSATGMAGNNGADWIHNEGLVDVDAISVLSASGGSNAIFGSASAGASLQAHAFATGLDGGDGDDIIENLSDVRVNAQSTLSSTTASFTFIGGASGSANLSAMAEATGMDGGNGSDQIYNGGSLLVGANASNTATGGAQTIIGDASAGATATATAFANGVSAGGDDDLVVNTGVLEAVANASPTSLSDVSAGGFFVDGVSQADTGSTTKATGVSLGSGANTLYNTGSLSALAGGAGLADAASTGSVFSLTADAFADASSEISATKARGVTAGDGDNQINNQGSIDATVAIITSSTADADGAGLVGGNGDANALARADAVSAIGIDVGNGDNLIANAGGIDVLAGHEATATSLSDANGINFFEAANSTAATLAFSDDALAIGIRAGDGGNTIWNGGTIAVTAAPEAFAWSRALSTDFSFAVDAAANAEASADNARAFGIVAGNGANLVHNAGTISVTSAPRAESIAHSAGKGWDGDAFSTATSNANGALAVGIFGGDGGNLVINDGSIFATATPAAFATATASPGGAELAGAVTNTVVCTWKSKWNIFNWILQKVCTVVADIADGVVDDGEFGEDPNVNINNAEAIGIWTGAGDDVIVNNGSIETWISAGAINRAGIAIRTGAGNDSVFLKDGSSLLGDVDLGADDDSLYLLGTPEATGDFYGGTGSDALLIDGSSQLFGRAYGFETLTLYGTSNFTLNNLQSVNDLGVYQGTLNVLGNYAMAPAGTFNVRINADGSHGQLNAVGNISLGGTLQVTNGSGPYVDGTTYDVVSAGSVSGSFASQSLPAATTLVSFSTSQDATTFNVVADVIPFTAMASGSSEVAVAGYLDDILAGSTGDLSELLAMMQAMDEDDFGAAFRSLNPGTYDTYQATDSTMRHHLAGTQSRMSSIRSSFRSSFSEDNSTFMSDREPVYLSAVNFDAQFNNVQNNGANISRGQPLDAWLVSFISDGSSGDNRSNVQGSNFKTSGMSMGIDYAIQDNLVAGVSFGSAFTKSDISGGYGQGEMGSSMTSFYATYLPSEDSYVETVISRARNYAMNKREFALGTVQREALSGRRSEIFSAFVETGKRLGTGPLRSEIFGSLYYSSLNEDGFEEVGAGDINIIVDARRYQTVSTELGWRGSRDYKMWDGLLTPQINITLLRNFDFGDKGLSARFAGAPDMSFSPAGGAISGYGIRLGLGLNFVEENGWAVQAKLNGETSGRRNNVSGILQLSRDF